MARSVEAAVVAVVASFLVPAFASAQSLADVAAKEKERRSGKAVKSYTEDDLRRAGGPVSSFETTAPDDSSAPAAGAEGSETAAADAPKEKSEDEQRAADEKAWREKLQKASDEYNGTVEQINQLQKNLNDLTGNYYSAGRTTMLNNMDQLKQKLASAQANLDALKEEGRRNRFRP